MILQLVDKYPDFKPLYEHIYSTCLNTEDIMGYFSKELQILDRNTVKYMIDQLQEENDRLRKENDRLRKENDRLRKENDILKNKIAEFKKNHPEIAIQVQLARYRELYGELPEE